MDLIEVLENRVSIRDFSSRQVDEDLLKRVVRQAQLTPSWANSQPWKVYVAMGDTAQQIRQEHLEKSLSGLKGQPELPVKTSTEWGAFPSGHMAEWLEKWDEELGRPLFKEVNACLFHAPVLVYLTVSKEAPVWAVHDTGAFAQTLMLAAQAEGLGSIIAYEVVKYPAEIRQHLGVPDDERIVSGLALGYPSEHVVNGFKAKRYDLDDVLVLKR